MVKKFIVAEDWVCRRLSAAPWPCSAPREQRFEPEGASVPGCPRAGGAVLPRRGWLLRDAQGALSTLLGQANGQQCFHKNTYGCFFFFWLILHRALNWKKKILL